jgi:superfamily II DNA or RNA helicase
MKLYNHQQKLLDLNKKKLLLAHSTGTGKTVSALALTQKNNQTALVIVPKALKENWRRNIETHGFNTNHKIVSKEEFRRDWDILPYYNAIIIDEFHFFGNLKSQMSKGLQKYIKKHDPEYIYGLTATPFCSSPMNIFALATHLGHKWNYWNFFNRFFNQVQMGRRNVPVQRTGIEDEVAELVRDIGDTCKLEDCVDVPEQTFETVYLELTAEQKKAIKEIDAPEAITRFTHQHTIENGVKIGDGYVADTYYKALKNDYIASFSDENPKFAVICRYNLQLSNLQKILEEKGKKVFLINGNVKNRDEVVQEVENTSECIILIQADCAIGFEIPSVPIMIFASLSYSFVSYKQSLGRILRINKLKKNIYQHLVIKDGVDEAVYNCIMKKQDFNIAIYNKENS